MEYITVLTKVQLETGQWSDVHRCAKTSAEAVYGFQKGLAVPTI